MWTSQVYGHHDIMARTKTQNITKHGVYKDATDKEITIFVFFGFFCVFLFLIFNYLKDFSKKCWITALVRSMKNIGGLSPTIKRNKLSPWWLTLDSTFSICRCSEENGPYIEVRVLINSEQIPRCDGTSLDFDRGFIPSSHSFELTINMIAMLIMKYMSNINSYFSCISYMFLCLNISSIYIINITGNCLQWINISAEHSSSFKIQFNCSSHLF